jgi:uncharacterized transporter YbjL
LSRKSIAFGLFVAAVGMTLMPGGIWVPAPESGLHYIAAAVLAVGAAVLWVRD